LYNNSMV